MTAQLSNSLTELADRVKAANIEAEDAAKTATEKAIDLGVMLLRARKECPHGDWTAFLGRAGIHERRARRLMRFAEAGIKTDSVSDLGGMTGALDFIARWRFPQAGETLVIRASDRASVVVMWPSDSRPGFFDVAVLQPESDVAVGMHPMELVKEGEPFFLGLTEIALETMGFDAPISQWQSTVVAQPLDQVRREIFSREIAA